MRDALPISDELKRLVSAYFNVNAIELAEELGGDFPLTDPDARLGRIRLELQDLVEHRRLSWQQWVNLTSDSTMDDEDELYAWIAEVLRRNFG